METLEEEPKSLDLWNSSLKEVTELFGKENVNADIDFEEDFFDEKVFMPDEDTLGFLELSETPIPAEEVENHIRVIVTSFAARHSQDQNGGIEKAVEFTHYIEENIDDITSDALLEKRNELIGVKEVKSLTSVEVEAEVISFFSQKNIDDVTKKTYTWKKRLTHMAMLEGKNILNELTSDEKREFYSMTAQLEREYVRFILGLNTGSEENEDVLSRAVNQEMNALDNAATRGKDLLKSVPGTITFVDTLSMNPRFPDAKVVYAAGEEPSSLDTDFDILGVTDFIVDLGPGLPIIQGQMKTLSPEVYIKLVQAVESETPNEITNREAVVAEKVKKRLVQDVTKRNGNEDTDKGIWLTDNHNILKDTDVQRMRDWNRKLWKGKEAPYKGRRVIPMVIFSANSDFDYVRTYTGSIDVNAYNEGSPGTEIPGYVNQQLNEIVDQYV